VQVALHVEEGQECEAHTVLASLSGSARSILSGERAALHILQYLSGVATWTALLIKEAAGHHCAILDGEGAPPCLRHLQRYALQVGGGKDRCEGTQRAVRVKLNHAALVSLQEAVRAVREQCADARIEVEIDAIGQLEAALACTPNAIVLDNLDLSAVREAVRRARGKVFLEAAGSMTLAKVRAYAAAGVSGVSIGALTHAPQAVDIAFKMDTTQL
jgi:nicotinate-nucleotide pyrophosphorylase (carboxylating)